MPFAHLDTTRYSYQSPGLNEDQNQLKNDEVATLKRLQFRSGSGQLGDQCMVVNFDTPGKNGASLGQLAYCMLQKLARQTASLEEIEFLTK